MPDFIDRLEAELVRAAGARPQAASARTPAWRSKRRVLHWRPLVLAVALIMVATAAAFAARAVFAPGTPVGPDVPPVPTANDGAAIPSSVKLLHLRVPDPHGAPPWGLRIVRTTRGEVCLQVGRLAYGTIGALGEDGAFHNDGRFHPFSDNYLDPLSCAVADRYGNAFLSLGLFGFPVSAMAPGPDAKVSGCLGGSRQSSARCPAGDTRDLYYGVLGPDAVSVTYRAGSGRLITTPTAGRDGAYLIVLPPETGHAQGTATIGEGLGGGPLSAVSYRDGHTCWVSLAHRCAPVGLVPVGGPRMGEAEIASTITVRKIPAKSYCGQTYGVAIVPCGASVPRGFARLPADPRQLLVEITYKARRAVNSSNSYYDVALFFPRSRGCTTYATDGPTNSDIRAGQRVTDAELVSSNCRGVIRVVVSYHPSTAPGNYSLTPGLLDDRKSLTVGRTTFRVP